MAEMSLQIKISLRLENADSMLAFLATKREVEEGVMQESMMVRMRPTFPCRRKRHGIFSNLSHVVA
jgi:hypothetical protein